MEDIKTAVVDYRITLQEKENLISRGINPIFTDKVHTSDSLSGHPDLQLLVTDDHIFINKDASERFTEEIRRNTDRTLIKTEIGLSPIYPSDTHFNCIFSGNSLIAGRTSLLPGEVLKVSPLTEVTRVKQGYVRCTTFSPFPGVFVTSDRGIEKALNEINMAVFYADPSSISLPGYVHGFIGGTCGVFKTANTLELYFYGDINHENYRDLREFINEESERRGITPKLISLSQGNLTDRGSIIFI